MTFTPQEPHELRPGLWHWTARHPEWTDADDPEQEGWGPDVTCYAIADENRIVLIDPAQPPGGLADLTGGLEATALLTCPWHERDAVALSLPIVSPSTEGENRSWEPTRTYAAGDDVPGGGVAYPGLEPIDCVLWFERHRALVFGDTLIDRGDGLELPDGWGPDHIDHGPVIDGLRELLELPIELALPTHGPPADRAAFERALG